MLICGIKASHDGGVALIDSNRLVFSIEVEKLGNAPRYSKLGYLERVGEILKNEGVDPRDVDQFVVDGWWPEGGGSESTIVSEFSGERILLPVANYISQGLDDPLVRKPFKAFHFDDRRSGYVSYPHITGHILAAYCTSPVAKAGEAALVVVWDGGSMLSAYWVDPVGYKVHSLGPVFPLLGNAFADFCSYFEPFYDPSYRDTLGEYDENSVRHHLSIAGKAMAYAALGTVNESAFEYFDRKMAGLGSISKSNAFTLGRMAAMDRESSLAGMSNADIIATFQSFLGREIIGSVRRLVERRLPGKRPNLLLGGGCALNIKWNSLFRDSGIFSTVWAPPFPNDSGGAIGAACAELFNVGQTAALEWSVYSGPKLQAKLVPETWLRRECDAAQIAHILHFEGSPIVVLTGRAELGPRALGNRSILAPAVDVSMKDRLNRIKFRDSYRPVAPICLESRASEVFSPGGADPYMLFDHSMRPGWAERVPAVVHLDGTARLQTVDPADGSLVGQILVEYEALSGIPVLCNTSANINGSGFFSDVASAADWGRTPYVWSDGILYANPDRGMSY